MSFKEAFRKLINTYGYDILHERFRTRSILSDYVMNDFYAKKLIDVFLLINSQYNIQFILVDKGLVEARAFFQSIYPRFKEHCTAKEFVDAINPISELVCPEQYKYYEENKVKKETKVVGGAEIVRKNPKPEAKAKGFVINKAQPVNNQKVNQTPVNGNKQNVNKTPGKANNVQVNAQANINNNYINLHNILAQRNKGNKTPKIKAKPNKIKFLEVSSYCDILSISQGTNQDIEVYIGGSKTPKTINSYVVKGDLCQMSLIHPGEKVEIRLPKKILRHLKIWTRNSNVIISPSKGKMKFWTIDVTNENGFIICNAQTKSIRAVSSNGNIQIFGETEHAYLNNVNGDISFGLYTIINKTLNITAVNINGNINVRFPDFVMPYNLRYAIKHKKKVKKKFEIHKRPVTLDISTINGILTVA